MLEISKTRVCPSARSSSVRGKHQEEFITNSQPSEFQVFKGINQVNGVMTKLVRRIACGRVGKRKYRRSTTTSLVHLDTLHHLYIVAIRDIYLTHMSMASGWIRSFVLIAAGLSLLGLVVVALPSPPARQAMVVVMFLPSLFLSLLLSVSLLLTTIHSRALPRKSTVVLDTRYHHAPIAAGVRR